MLDIANIADRFDDPIGSTLINIAVGSVSMEVDDKVWLEIRRQQSTFTNGEIKDDIQWYCYTVKS